MRILIINIIINKHPLKPFHSDTAHLLGILQYRSLQWAERCGNFNDLVKVYMDKLYFITCGPQWLPHWTLNHENTGFNNVTSRFSLMLDLTLTFGCFLFARRFFLHTLIQLPRFYRSVGTLYGLHETSKKSNTTIEERLRIRTLRSPDVWLHYHMSKA